MNISKLVTALLVALIATLTYESDLRIWFDRYEEMSIDWRFQMRGRQFTNDKIVIVEVDHAAFAKQDSFPVHPYGYTQLIEALDHFGADAIAFHFPLYESGYPEGDLLLERAITNAQNVFLPVDYDEDGEQDGRFKRSAQRFERSAKGLGHVRIQADRDSRIRRVKPFIEYRNESYAEMGLRLAMDVHGLRLKQLIVQNDHIELPISNNPVLKIPVTDKGDILLNWAGRWKDTYQHARIGNVIEMYKADRTGRAGEQNSKIFQNALCLIVMTESSLAQMIVTPTERSVPAASVSATVLNSVLEKRFLMVPKDSLNLIVLWLISGVLYLSMFSATLWRNMLQVTLIAVFYIVFSAVAFNYMGIATHVAYPLLVILICIVVLAVYQFVATSMDKRRLLRLVIKDGLTGLTKFEHFRDLLNAEIRKIEKFKVTKELSMVMLDIDHFKRVNDTYGHGFGDLVLKAVAEIMLNHCRAKDVACRFGGEEFILLLPEVGRQEAIKISERMRQIVERRIFYSPKDKSKVHVSASFGVVRYQGGENSESMIRRADEALYLAKNGGRNMVCWR